MIYKRLWSAVSVVGLLFATSGCTVAELTRDRLLVWHDWPEPEAAVLEELLSSYADVDPDLELIVEYVPDDEIEERFAKEVASGFGPDVLIGADASDIADLVAAGAVHRITEGEIEQSGFGDLDDKAMAAMAVDGAQSGIPLAAFTDVLYYRKGVTPPETLDDVIDLAEDGHPAAIPMDFLNAYWGVDAFDGSVFGPNGEVAPDEGFVEWMKWLVDARPHPNIILDGEYDVLRDLFAQGRIDLFVGGSRELGTFRAHLRESSDGTSDVESAPDPGATVDDGGDGQDTTALQGSAAPTLADINDVSFGITVLPSGTNAAPGGLMDVEGMVVNQYTASMSASLDLMEYLTNVPSQGRIARSGVGRIPVNGSVSIDPTISPIESALVAQQRRALVLPRRFDHHRQELTLASNEVVAQVARGLLEPEEAPQALRTDYQQLVEEAADE